MGKSSKRKRRMSAFEILKRLWPYVWRYRRTFVLVLIFGGLSALFLKSMYLAIEPLTGLLFPENPEVGANLAEDAEESGHFVSQHFDRLKEPILDFLGIRSEGSNAQARDAVIALAMIVMVVSVFAGVTQFLFVVLTRRVGISMVVDLRNDIAAHLLRQSLGYHGRSKKGDTISRMSSDVQVTLRMFNLLFQEVLQEPIFLLLNLCIAFYAAPLLTVYLFLLMPLLALPMGILGRRVRKGSRGSLSALGESTSVLTDMLSGIRVVKAFRMEEKESEAFRERNKNFLRKTMRMVRTRATSQSVQVLIAYGGLAVVIIGLAHLQLPDDPSQKVFTDKQDFMLFLAAFGTTFNHVKRLSKAYNTVQESLGGAERLFEILDYQTALPEVKDPKTIDRVRRGIVLDDVHFTYGEEPTLTGVSFDIPVGTRLALVGPSGAGKSTLLDLIARFYDPTRGRVMVDGIDLREMDIESWLARLALVTQQPFLFHTTIEENIRYARPGVTQEQVVEAARAAAIHEFIQELPQGYQTIVGEQGARLSGGQLQRITIARALVKEPDVLLLDEATSSLDVESEALVHGALENLMRGRTSIIVAHRLSTVRSADRLVVLDQGRVVETGTHDELYQRGGLYRRLCDMQLEM